MELPSMVQRSGDTLIVRSVVSGNQLYLDQGAAGSGGGSSTPSGAHAHTPSPNHQLPTHNSNASALEQHLERCRAAAAAAQQHHYQQQQSATQQQAAAAAAAAVAQQQALELKDEGLPQCKIKRNYSCNYCTYFTQNPRYHLTHLRDVHGEKIVINKCKLCLYASRHFQKLVRHMKMVHGCTDGIAGGHGQSRGKRGMSREARKRKLEQSVGLGLGMAAMSDSMPKMPTYEQVKREMELQRDMQVLKQQEEKKQQLTTIFAAAYERELLAHRERELEASRQQQKQEATQNSYEQEAQAAADAQRRQTPPTNNSSSNNNTGFHMAQTAHQPLHMASRSLELSPSPTGSASPIGDAATPQPATSNSHLNNTSADLSLSYAEEPTQNRLLKCSVCDFTTLFRAQLVDHEMDEHCKTKFFRCEKCSYVTHIKARFSKHVKYHSMPMIKCVTCDFRTPYKWNLDRHMKNHGGAGPFKCAACDFTADIKQSLTVHEMNHHVPPVGHAAGMSLARRRNKVGGTDLCDDFLSDSAELEDHYNNNNLDDYDDALLVPETYGKRSKYDEDEPTDLSQKGGSSDTSSVHNQIVTTLTPKAKRPVPNLIPIPTSGKNILNLSKDFAASRSSLTEIASMFFNEKQISEMLQPLEKSDAAQLSPTTTIASNSSQNSRNLLQKKNIPGGSFFDKLKSSALASGGPNENLICPCGHTAKCLSESIIHRKACNFAAIADDDIEEEQDDSDDRLEIDFADDDDKQSHSALNLSVTGSTRCQHCRHRCKSSADLLNHLAHCREASRCGNESYDSLSGDSSAGRAGNDTVSDQQHPMENRVFIWNKMPRGGAGARENSQCSEGQQGNSGGESATSGGSTIGNGTTEENSYYGVETAPGYGEMTPEEEAANSSLKKVYKCPHCSFWASTASRFHVHIVGHLNKKPFECSLCSYRSNWRWDITKHIRLKTIRDPSHKNARVLMNDETGRRNYTKYNKYITLMKVTEEDGDPKLMKSGEMTPNQVASLSFLNDFNKSVVANVITGTHLNGVKEDITLEPVPTKAGGSTVADAENQLSEGFIRLPLLATMVNAAMAQHQHQQKEQEQQHATMITPSVTISAVKRSPPPLMKPSDDLVTDVKQEGNEKKTFYKCRKCNFRHMNRDAVLAHVKIHYQDSNYPIITATATASPKSASSQSQQAQHNTPLQVAVNPNLYMNKVFAAMCLSQQQQQQQNSSSSSSNNAHQPQHSMLPAGLLQQAIQNGTVNASHSGLALALAGKSPAKATASILEHGEQKANQNEASAQAPTSPTIATTCLSSSSSSPATSQLTASGGAGSNGSGATGGSAGAAASPSLQHLLTSPRGTYTSSAHAHRNQLNSPIISGGSGGGIGTNNNKNLVMGALTGAGLNGAITKNAASVFSSPTTTATTVTHQQQQQPQTLQSSPVSSPSLNAAATMSTIRHCRLKHAGDIRIETLDRTAVGERHAPPVYRPLGNGASNETNYGLTLKALQQQQPHLNNNSTNNSVLMNKAEHLLHSPLAGTAAAHGAHTPQELKQAAAAYLAYKAAEAAAANPGAASALSHLNNDDLLLHQQLQQNDQIEITRLPASAASGSGANAQQQNSKCKQQKCPLCPYISESKSQMNYHISLHKPTQYECSMCTFVCAKKQHLSSHMRTVHQQHTGNSLGALTPMDYMALQLAVAQYDSGALSNSPTIDLSAIDLSSLKNAVNAHKQQIQQPQVAVQQQPQPVDSQMRVICHCPKCPARFVQKTRDIQSSRVELEEHLKSHNLNSNETSQYLHKCEFCDFKAVHEPHLQKHRYVHSQHYQDKISELYGLYREDIEYAAPKLMQITLTKNLQTPETVWIVDTELCEQNKHQQQQHANISSSTNAHFDNANSLLKKQLESGPVAPTAAARNSPSPKAADGDDSSNMPSTSASVATSDLAVDAGSEFASSVASPAILEKCLHCPYETKNTALYKAHLQHHICISNQKEKYTCEHCDYSDADKAHIDEHTRVHFNAIEKLKNVAFFTSYDNLELSVEQNADEESNVGEESMREQDDGEKPKANAETSNACNVNIKQEHNNNNEENAINENTLQEQLGLEKVQEKHETAKSNNNTEEDKAAALPAASTGDSLKKHCNKIILYKNDGCLSIKRDNNNSNSSENISDRLRRRISRNSSSHMNGVGNNSNNNNNDEQTLPPLAQQSHKTILVNAKTGQVISRN